MFQLMDTKNKKIWLFSAAVLAVIVSALVLKQFLVQESVYPIKRNIRYGFTVQNKTNKLLENVDFWVYGPVKQTSTQKAGLIDASIPFNVTVDDLGNQLLHFKIDKLPPFGAKIISINAEVNLTDTPNTLSRQDVKQYLASEKYMETSDNRLKQLSVNFKSDTKRDTAEKIYKWVNANIQYAGYIKDDRGALYALKTRKGDCTEFMYLYNALARIADIPSRGVGGYVYSENSILKPEDFHNWSEIYLDNKWQIVDAQNGVFLDKQSHFIAMRILSQQINNNLKLKNTHQFASSSDEVSVKMN